MYISYYNLFLLYLKYYSSFMILVIGAYLFCTYLSYWRLFQKMGINPWYGIIPFVNEYKIFEMAWGDGYFCLFEFLPFVGMIFRYIMLYKMCQAMEMTNRMFVIFVFIFPVLGRLALAFGNAKYIGPEGRDVSQNPYRFKG